MSDEAKSTRSSISISTKLDIIRDVDRGMRKKDVAAKYKIAFSTLSTITNVKNREKLKKASSQCQFSKKKKRIRQSAYPEIDDAVYKWVINCKQRKISICGPIIKGKARHLALVAGKSFSPGNGWLSRFKKRYNLSFQKVCGEEGCVDVDTIKNWLEENKDTLRKYAAKDQYNADEAALFWKLQPNHTTSVRSEKCSGGKLSKVRITLLLCANRNGSDKRELVVIGKSKNPVCFKKRGRPTRVMYLNNQKAWMTQVLFTQWLSKFDDEMTKEGRKILLIIDNCTAHSVNPTLKSIELLFLPPNTTSKLQPCDQGIIQNLKVKYRKRLIERLIARDLNNFSMEIDLKGAIEIVTGAWTDVKSETIANCWKHALEPEKKEERDKERKEKKKREKEKNKQQEGEEEKEEEEGEEEMEEEEVESEEDESSADEDDMEIDDGESADAAECYQLWSQLKDKDTCSFEEYANIDEDVEVCAGSIDESLEADLMGIAPDESSEEEEGGSQDPVAPPTLSASLSALSTVKHYALTTGLGESYDLLCRVEDDFIRNACKAKTVQKTIDQFFRK